MTDIYYSLKYIYQWLYSKSTILFFFHPSIPCMGITLNQKSYPIDPL